MVKGALAFDPTQACLGGQRLFSLIPPKIKLHCAIADGSYMHKQYLEKGAGSIHIYFLTIASYI